MFTPNMALPPSINGPAPKSAKNYTASWPQVTTKPKELDGNGHLFYQHHCPTASTVEKKNRVLCQGVYQCLSQMVPSQLVTSPTVDTEDMIR